MAFFASEILPPRQFPFLSQQLGWQSRLRWIYAPGRDLFVVVGLGWQRQTDESLVPTEQALTLKVAHTLRF